MVESEARDMGIRLGWKICTDEQEVGVSRKKSKSE